MLGLPATVLFINKKDNKLTSLLQTKHFLLYTTAFSFNIPGEWWDSWYIRDHKVTPSLWFDLLINLCHWTHKTLQKNNPEWWQRWRSSNINETLQLVAHIICLFWSSPQKVFTIIETWLLFFCSGSTNDKTKMSVTDKLQLMLLKDYPPICSLLPFVVALIHPTSTTTKQLWWWEIIPLHER